MSLASQFRYRPQCESLEERYMLSGTALSNPSVPSPEIVRVEARWDTWGPKGRPDGVYQPGKDFSLAGSGVMIDSFHVLTAAHVAWPKDTTVPKKAPRWIAVSPGQDGGNQPFAEALAVAHLPKQYRGVKGDSADMGLLTLDRNLGDHTGSFPMRLKTDAQLPATVQVIGYPDAPLGDTFHQIGVTAKLVTPQQAAANGYLDPTQRLYYVAPTEHGLSGSPILDLSDPARPTVIGVHASGESDTGMPPSGVRITQQKYDWLQKTIKRDRPPVDKPDVAVTSIQIDHDAFAGTATVTARITNLGTKEATNIGVAFYGSPDATVTTKDWSPGSTQIPALQPFASTTIEWTGTLPEGTSAVGVLLNLDKRVREFTNLNNSRTLKVTGTVTPPTTNPPPTNPPPTSNAPTLQGLQALWDVVRLTKNANQAPWLSEQFGVGEDAVALLLRPGDDAEPRFGNAWQLVLSARPLIVQAVELFELALEATGTTQSELVARGNDLLAQAKPLIAQAEAIWNELWWEHWA